VSGGNATHLAGRIECAIAQGGRAVMSFGTAGGLGEELKPGTCLIGSEVVYAGELYRADAGWTRRLARLAQAATVERVAGVDRAVSNPADKRALQAATGAAAADMESHCVAAVASRYGLPFAVVRVIADPVSRKLPPAALAGMRSDGGADIGACLRSLVRDPSQLPTLASLAVDTARALLQLLRCVQTLGPGLGFFDRG
jgi:hopanoid-associated phosphorylase